MAPEKQLNEGMPIKQKLTIGAVVVVVLVILWQMKGLFGIGGSSTPAPSTPPPMTKMSATAPIAGAAGHPMVNNTTMSAAPPQPTAAGQAAPVPSQPVQAQLPEMEQTPEITEVQQAAKQQKYLNKLNELEELKVQQSIAETNQAIATAKLATVTAEKDITDLLTKPTIPVLPPPALPASAYANQLSGPASVTVTSETKAVPLPPIIEEPYTVISVTMQFNKWSAVLGNQGKLYTVSVGDILPPDNSVVYRINRNGVVLKKSNKTRKISITSSI